MLHGAVQEVAELAGVESGGGDFGGVGVEAHFCEGVEAARGLEGEDLRASADDGGGERREGKGVGFDFFECDGRRFGRRGDEIGASKVGQAEAFDDGRESLRAVVVFGGVGEEDVGGGGEEAGGGLFGAGGGLGGVGAGHLAVVLEGPREERIGALGWGPVGVGGAEEK